MSVKHPGVWHGLALGWSPQEMRIWPQLMVCEPCEGAWGFPDGGERVYVDTTYLAFSPSSTICAL